MDSVPDAVRVDDELLLTPLVPLIGRGEGALVAARRFRPEVGVLDVGLPGTDGLTLARDLKRVPGLEQLRLIAVSGYGQAADRNRALAAGMDEHLVKPVAIERLDAAIASLD